ncbi:DUF6889 family protein [Yersinia kristensenii]|uniref:Lytic transglycosylase n=1 Tax=Yersinia kristensenii TaxID=28152 RepID=A0A0T9KLR6_YERKR|nr:hypothetical protein [Yersinia kristensenii]CNE11620.1 Uncharacterised protein [Yersinia kristensenii]
MLDTLPGGEDFILRPVKYQLTTMGEIKSGNIDLLDIALLNDYLDLDAENQAKIDKWRADHEQR